MKTLHLKRNYLDNGTYGKLFLDGELFCYTVERPWLSNRQDISCIPPGMYRLYKHHSASKGDVMALVNPDLGVTLKGPSQRTYCYFHVANFPHEVQGCIAPGMNLHPGAWGVIESKDAMAMFMDLMGSGEFQVLISAS